MRIPDELAELTDAVTGEEHWKVVGRTWYERMNLWRISRDAHGLPAPGRIPVCHSRTSWIGATGAVTGGVQELPAGREAEPMELAGREAPMRPARPRCSTACSCTAPAPT